MQRAPVDTSELRRKGLATPQPGDVFVRYGRAYMAGPPRPIMMPRWRPLATITADIRRATVPALRPEDV